MQYLIIIDLLYGSITGISWNTELNTEVFIEHGSFLQYYWQCYHFHSGNGPVAVG